MGQETKSTIEEVMSYFRSMNRGVALNQLQLMHFTIEISHHDEPEVYA